VSFISFPGKIHLINSDADLQAVAPDLAAAKIFGFDTETRPAFKKGESFKVALVQLSTESNAYIIRMHYLTNFDLIKNIFEKEDVIKVGVAVLEDIKKLQKSFKFVARGFIEMQTIAKQKGLKNFGLKGMTEEVLNASLSKGPKLTNWEARVLDGRQLMYAATDAWVGLKLYNKLVTETNPPTDP
jgi:ribonuclease D